MECAISVIVPIYKAENYLRKCVDGILQQTFTDFQWLSAIFGSIVMEKLSVPSKNPKILTIRR